MLIGYFALEYNPLCMHDNNLYPIFQVSEFNELINQHLNLLGEVTIEGELTRMDVKNNRLIFGSIKDKYSSLDFFSMAHLLPNFRQFEPGMLVRITGTAGVYKATTKFRLMANSIVPQGEGSLQIAFEKLKAQLEAEGLFDPARKRPLPKWPQSIGLITAKDSSAYFDLVKILTARMGGLHLKLLPVNVQGKEAVPTILKAFDYVNAHPQDFDLIIMARGGGSLEDLQAFNTEELARAVFSAKVPIISAIGHEDNWSLTDYVADLRASTPSNAAELAVKDRNAVVADINASLQFIQQAILHRLSQIKSATLRADIIVHQYSSRLHHQIDKLLQTVTQKIHHHLALTQHNIDSLTRLLQSLDYRHVLNRGFSITTDISGKIIKSTTQVTKNQPIITQLAQGELKSYVN